MAQENNKKDRIGRELDSLSGTYRSIPTTGQNSQIWYFPIQFKPVEEIEEKVNKKNILLARAERKQRTTWVGVVSTGENV